MTYSDTIYINQALARLEVSYMELAAELRRINEEIRLIQKAIEALSASSSEMNTTA